MIRRKNNISIPYIVLIDFTPSAEEWSVTGDINKRIYHIYGGSIPKGVTIADLEMDAYQNGDTEPYSPIKVAFYKRQGYIIRDLTKYQSVPKRALNMTSVEVNNGFLEIERRLR